MATRKKKDKGTKRRHEEVSSIGEEGPDASDTNSGPSRSRPKRTKTAQPARPQLDREAQIDVLCKQYKAAQLRELASAADIVSSGNKREIVRRLLDADVLSLQDPGY